jgi:hypothetical protein
VNWPDPGDPFYLHNPAENSARKSYYTVNLVPSFRFDGKKLKDPWEFPVVSDFYPWMRHTLDSLTAIPAKIRINLEQTRADDTVHVSFDVVGADTSTYMNLFLAVVEDANFATHQESTFVDTLEFTHIFRDMLPNTSGLGITPPLHDSLHFDWSYPIPLGQTDLNTVIFLQKGGSKVLFQAARAPIDPETGVAAGAAPPRAALLANAPNPFNPSTAIRFRLVEAGRARLVVYDGSGRLVAELLNASLGAGLHEVFWNGLDRSGRTAGSGQYFCRLEVGGGSGVRKLTLLR